MQIVTGNHFFQEFSSKNFSSVNKVKNEENHHGKSPGHHNASLPNQSSSQLSTQTNSLHLQQKSESISYRESNQTHKGERSEVSYSAASSSVSFSFSGSVEDSNRLLYNSISQKLDVFEQKHDGSQLSFKYDSSSTETSFESLEETSNLLISKIRQLAGSFGLSSPESANDDHHGKSASLAQPTTQRIAQPIVPNGPVEPAPAVPLSDASADKATDELPIPIEQPLITALTDQKSDPSIPVASVENIRNAVDSGFQESTNAIQQYGSFSSNVSHVFAEIRQRLDDVLQALNQPTSTTINANYFKYDNSSETSIQIRTNDGDVVNINFSSSSHQEYSDGSVKSNSLSANATSYQRDSQNNISFSVEGELDEGELKAIEKLVGGIQKAANSYSQDDISSALAAIDNKKFDISELQSYQFESKTVEEFKAISLYQQFAAEETEAGGVNNPSLTRHVDLAIGSILELLAEAEQTNIAKPGETISQLVEGLNRQSDAPAPAEQSVQALPGQGSTEFEHLNLVA